ncbi:MAG: hypothetical protein ACI38A_04545 [Candidatus Ornithomonoglobus sp.]
MEKFLKWINKHKKLIAAFIILLVFLPIAIIHILFKWHSNCSFIEAEWEAGEVLGYFGDVLSFVGTVVLGYVAIAQTEKANQLNKELLNIEKDRVKPCMDISSSQLYKIFLSKDMHEKLVSLDRNNAMIMNLLYTSNPRSGVETNSVLIEIEVLNTGYSDIRRIIVKNVVFYLAVTDPFNSSNKKIAMLSGNSSLKKGESKKLYIYVNREISTEEELYNKWYEDNIDKLMPHIELELVLETVTGQLYIEEIVCGSGWDISMQNSENTATRSIGVTNIMVKEKI